MPRSQAVFHMSEMHWRWTQHMHWLHAMVSNAMALAQLQKTQGKRMRHWRLVVIASDTTFRGIVAQERHYWLFHLVIWWLVLNCLMSLSLVNQWMCHYQTAIVLSCSETSPETAYSDAVTSLGGSIIIRLLPFTPIYCATELQRPPGKD